MIHQNKNSGNSPYLEIIEVVLVYCIIFNNYYQHKSRVLYAIVPNKSFSQLLDISTKNFAFLKPRNSEFSYTEVRFTDQNSKPLEIGDKINITLVFN